MIASRAGDHYLDLSIVYSKPPGPGVWQPNAGTTNMAVAWLGSVRTLVLGEFVTVGGPDRLASPSWAMDYNEVKAYGRATGSARQPGHDRHRAVLQLQRRDDGQRRARPLPPDAPAEPEADRPVVRHRCMAR